MCQQRIKLLQQLYYNIFTPTSPSCPTARFALIPTNACMATHFDGRVMSMVVSIILINLIIRTLQTIAPGVCVSFGVLQGQAFTYNRSFFMFFLERPLPLDCITVVPSVLKMLRSVAHGSLSTRRTSWLRSPCPRTPFPPPASPCRHLTFKMPPIATWANEGSEGDEGARRAYSEGWVS